MKICKNCGAQNDDMCVYCGSCGSLLDSSSSFTVNTEETQTASFVSGDRAQTSGTYQSQQTYAYRPEATNYQSAGQPYNSPYQQNNGYTGYNPIEQPGMPRGDVKKGSIIAALILSFITGGLLSIVFAIIALVAANDFESAKLRGEVQLANKKFDSANKFRKLAWAFNIIGLIVNIALIAILFVTGFFLAEDSDFWDELDDPGYYEEFEDGNFAPFGDEDFDFDIDL